MISPIAFVKRLDFKQSLTGVVGDKQYQAEIENLLKETRKIAPKNKEAHLSNVDLEVKETKAGKGLGLYPKSDLQPGDVLGVYGGLITRAVGEMPDETAYYFTVGAQAKDKQIRLLWDDYVIDGQFYHNNLSFVNHSETPNLVIESVVDGFPYVVFVVGEKVIAAGEELSIDYGPNYYYTWGKE